MIAHNGSWLPSVYLWLPVIGVGLLLSLALAFLAVRPGDSLRLLCTKEHQFGSPQDADGWACRWGQVSS